jgi:hypothetical protein
VTNRRKLQVLAMAVVVAGGMRLAAQAPGGRVRTIPFGMPIAERLRPDDEVVIVDRPRPLDEPATQPTAAELFKKTLDASEIVMTATAEDIRGVLVEQETWVNTLVMFKLDRTLKDPNRSLPFGALLNLEWSGGVLPVGTTQVKGWEPPQIKMGGRYLIFHSGKGPLGIVAVYGIEDGKLTSTWAPDPRRKIKDALEGASFDELVPQIPFR